MAFDSRRGVVVMYGGATMTADGQTAHLEDMWQWNGHRWAEIELDGPSPGKRYSPAMAFDASRGRVVLTGELEVRGRGDFTVFDDVWEWMAPAGHGHDEPGPRISRHTMTRFVSPSVAHPDGAVSSSRALCATG